MATIKPIYLFADSQLLFWRDDEGLYLARVRALLDEDLAGREPKAAYLGASNGDRPEFYELFLAAMHEIGIADCRHVPAAPEAADLAFLDEADLILLAGGDVRQGWEAFKEHGVHEKLVARYYAGALLIGISAGAVQLGQKGWSGSDEPPGEALFDTLRLVPFVVDVHDEPGWARLVRTVPRAGEHARGIGVPSGGGAVYHPDYSVEPIRHPLVEASLTEEGVRQALLFPGEGAADAGAADEAGAGPEFPGLQELMSQLDDAPAKGGDDPVN